MIVRLEKITLSGTELELKPPVVIRDDEVLEIHSNGSLVWATSGLELAKFAIRPEPSAPPSTRNEAR